MVKRVIIEVILGISRQEKSMHVLPLLLVGHPIPQEVRPEALTMGVIKAYEQ